MSSPRRVFISRTDESALRPYVEAAVDVVRELEWIPVNYKDWGSKDQLSVDACREAVERCNTLVVLVAHRYGWVPGIGAGDDAEKSITWWEVTWAEQRNLKVPRSVEVLRYVIDDDVPWPPNQVEDGLGAERLERFKAELSKHLNGHLGSDVGKFKARLSIDLGRLPPPPDDRNRDTDGRSTPAPTPPGYSYHTLKIRLTTDATKGTSASVVEVPSGVTAPAPFALEASVSDLTEALWSGAIPIVPPARKGGAGIHSDAALPSSVSAKNVGEILYRALVQPPLRRCLDEILERCNPQEGQGARIVLDIDDSCRFGELPWELLWDPARRSYLFNDPLLPLVRVRDIRGAKPSLRVSPPLRLLIVAATPSDLPPIDVTTELERLESELGELKTQGRIKILSIAHATRETLVDALGQFKPHILHVIAHGYLRNGEGVIAVEEESPASTSDPISGERLGVLLRVYLSSLRLVFLNSCLTAAAARGNVVGGVAQSLIAHGVPAVVAMQFPIPDRAAVALAERFYSFLADDRPVDAALTSARAALYFLHEVEWSAPVLYMQSADGRLFELGLPPPVPSPASAASPAASPGAVPALPPALAPAAATSTATAGVAWLSGAGAAGLAAAAVLVVAAVATVVLLTRSAEPTVTRSAQPTGTVSMPSSSPGGVTATPSVAGRGGTVSPVVPRPTPAAAESAVARALAVQRAEESVAAARANVARLEAEALRARAQIDDARSVLERALVLGPLQAVELRRRDELARAMEEMRRLDAEVSSARGDLVVREQELGRLTGFAEWMARAAREAAARAEYERQAAQRAANDAQEFEGLIRQMESQRQAFEKAQAADEARRAQQAAEEARRLEAARRAEEVRRAEEERRASAAKGQTGGVPGVGGGSTSSLGRRIRAGVLVGYDFTQTRRFSTVNGTITEDVSHGTVDALAGATIHVTEFEPGRSSWYSHLTNPFVAVSLSHPANRFVVGTAVMHRSGVSLNVGVAFNVVPVLANGVRPGDQVGASNDIPQVHQWKAGPYLGVGASIRLDAFQR